MRNGSLSVASSGQIRGTTEEGIYSTDNGIVTNSGEISGSDGIHFDNKGAFDNSDATVVNKASGVITSTTPFGSALRLTGYSLDLNNAGEVTGGASGVFLTGSTAPADPLDSAFILNSGRISALSDTAIFVSEATLELTNTGQIDGSLGVLQTTLNDSTGQGEITNSGTISGWRAEGVFMDSPGIVTNSGEIWGVDAVHFESGVGFSNTSATLVNSSTGLIASNDTNGRGLYSERLSLDLNNAGEIIGGGNAIYVEGTQGLENPANTAELQNTGLISSTDATAIVVFDATLNLTNDGVISGDLGVFHSNSFVPTGPAQVFNSGTIIGTGGEGLELLQSATVENTGTIRGATAAIEGGDEKNALINSGDIVGSIVFKNGADTITNTGDILGFVGLGSGENQINNSGNIGGNILLGVDDDIVFNPGTILGDVTLGDGNDFFDALGVGVVGGTIFGGEGDDTIQGTGANAAIDGGEGNDVINGEPDIPSLSSFTTIMDPTDEFMF